MAKLEVFDRAMCCSTGVCGPSVDPVLPRFAADLEWLKRQGVQVERYNLGHQPEPFFANPEIKEAMETNGLNCLPLIRVDGHTVSKGMYPVRDVLAKWTGVAANTESAIAKSSCCGSDGSACC